MFVSLFIASAFNMAHNFVKLFWLKNFNIVYIIVSGSYLNSTSVNTLTTKYIIFVAICHQEVNKINATKILILNIQLLC